MASVVLPSIPVLESRLFNRVLSIYVADNAQSFVSAALSLLGADHLCDFSVALVRKPASRFYVAHHAYHEGWSFFFVQQQVAILRAIRKRLPPDQKIFVVGSNTDASDEHLCRYLADVLEPLGSTHAALLFFGDQSEPISLLISVHRSTGAPEFSAEELTRLEACRGYIENAWSLLTQRLLSRVVIDGISTALRNYDLGTVMLDPHFRVLWHNPAARAAIVSWRSGQRTELKPARTLGRMPADIIAACERLRDEWLDSPGLRRLREPRVVRHASIAGQTATIRLHGVRQTGIVSPGFIIQFCTPSNKASAAKTSITQLLTSTEREVARLVRQGMTNQEIADALGKSVDAVKFHLHQMFKKADVTTRSRLMLALT